MRLVANWRAVLRYAWSVRLNLLAALPGGAEMAIQLAGPALPIPPLMLGALSFVVTVAAAIALFVAQPKTIGESHADH
ncbi:MAG: hypothetical protein K0S00_4825 [Xanthobacteraceae bacterium]|jgi:hypothetical protein|nr:hypothetical protein [Xanthobacteraceae bacterium]